MLPPPPQHLPPFFLPFSPTPFSIKPREHKRKLEWEAAALCPHPRAPPVCSAHSAGGSSGPWRGRAGWGGAQETGSQNWGTRGCPSVVPPASFWGDTPPARPACGASCDVGLGGSGTLAGVQRSSRLPVPGPRRDAMCECGGGSLLVTPLHASSSFGGSFADFR